VETNCPLLHVTEDYPKEVILRDGSGMTLRPLGKTDATALFRMLSRLPDEDKWFLGIGGAREISRKWARNAEADRVFSIAAVLEGEMTALATLVRQRPGAEGHLGRIQMTVVPEYRERRLGTWMMLDLINAAMTMGLEMLYMHLVAGRDDALMRGVEKLKFRKEALLRAFAKDPQGGFLDVAVMIKRLPLEIVGD